MAKWKSNIELNFCHYCNLRVTQNQQTRDNNGKVVHRRCWEHMVEDQINERNRRFKKRDDEYKKQLRKQKLGVNQMKTIYSTDKNYTELDVELLVETERAIKISEGTTEEWIPKSQLEDEYETLPNGLIRITIPEWLAKEKGFI